MSSEAELVARLNALPNKPFSRRVVRVFAFVFLFEFADITTFSVTAPALQMDIGLSLGQVAHITSATFAGMFVGACAAGALSRRCGRLRTIRWFLVCFSLGSVGSALSYDEASMLSSRLVTGAGLAALTVSAITYIAETVPMRRRVQVQATITGLGLLGVPLVAVFALGVVPLAPWGWRLVFVLGALGLVGLVGLCRVPESPVWLLSRGHEARARNVVSLLEAETTSLTGQPPPDLAEPGPVASGKVSVASLFQRGYALRTTVLWSVWFLQTIAVYGFSAFVPVLLVARGVTLVGSLGYTLAIAFGAAPGAFLARPLAAWCGHTRAVWMSCLLAGASGIVFGLAINPVTTAVSGFLITLFSMSFVSLFYSYTPGSYPTELRSLGTGLAYGIGRLANIIGPFLIIGIFYSVGYFAVYAFVSGCWVACAALIWRYASDHLRRPSGLAAEAPAHQRAD